MSDSGLQWVRSIKLIVSEGTEKTGGQGIDLSNLRIKFDIESASRETPDNAAIRIYNPAPETVQKARREFTRVTLQAGYENGATAVVFDGTTRQYGWGREGPTDTYMDVFASASDLEYCWSFQNKTLAGGVTHEQVLKETAKDMGVQPDQSSLDAMKATGGVLPRGKVLFGMARAQMRSLARTHEAQWFVQNGRVYVLPLDSYLPGEPVVINMESGMIGMPQQVDGGIIVRVLLNPRIKIGQRVILNNKDVAQRAFAKGALPIAYNQRAGHPLLLADVARGDGTYMVFAISTHGDTRGQEWYSDLTLLSIDPSSNKVLAQ